MTRWFRWYAGSVEDAKFRVVARMSRVTVRDVVALWAFLLEDASDYEHRGECTRNEMFMAAALDFEDGAVGPILEAMKQLGMIKLENETIVVCNWDERQFESDADRTATRRKREQRQRERERDKNKGHAPVTRDTGGSDNRIQIQITESNSEANASGAEAPPDPTLPEKEFFRRGKEVLGKSSGGQLAKLLSACGKNVALARSKLELAATKQAPAEFLAGVIRAGPQQPFAKPLTEFQRKQQETRHVLDALDNPGESSIAIDRELRIDYCKRPPSVRGGPGADILALPKPPRCGSS